MTDPSSRTDPDGDASRARSVLPSVDDLFGTGWEPDGELAGDDESDGGLLSLRDACLPSDFPERAVVAGDDVSYFRPGSAGLHALSAVFDAAPAAEHAWSVVQRDEFVSCFVDSLIADAGLADAVDLLGPVIHPADVDLDPRGVAVAVHHAELSSASASRVLPIVLRLAALLATETVVLVWSVDQGGSDSLRAWEHVIDRVIARCATGD